MNFDPYEVLGLHRDASDELIKVTYNKLILQWHPDRNNSTYATETFRLIRDAWFVLKDKEKKKEYDSTLVFESNSNLFKEISMSDMKRNAADDIYFTICRCGGRFEVI